MFIEQIQKDLNTALKEKNELQVSTLRLLLSEIHNCRIEKQAELTEEDIVAVLRKEAKKRQEAIEAYQQAGRQELVAKESKELDILSKYLPQELSGEEVEKVVKETINEIGTVSQQDFGRVMSKVMEKLKGKVDGSKVAQAVKKLI